MLEETRQRFVYHLLLMRGDLESFVKAYDSHGRYGEMFTGDGTI